MLIINGSAEVKLVTEILIKSGGNVRKMSGFQSREVLSASDAELKNRHMCEGD